MIERAKGILMATHRIGEHEAFERLRTQSRRSRRRLVAVAEAIVDSHTVLLSELDPTTRKE